MNGFQYSVNQYPVSLSYSFLAWIVFLCVHKSMEILLQQWGFGSQQITMSSDVKLNKFVNNLLFNALSLQLLPEKSVVVQEIDSNLYINTIPFHWIQLYDIDASISNVFLTFYRLYIKLNSIPKLYIKYCHIQITKVPRLHKTLIDSFINNQ